MNLYDNSDNDARSRFGRLPVQRDPSLPPFFGALTASVPAVTAGLSGARDGRVAGLERRRRERRDGRRGRRLRLRAAA